MIKGLIEIWSSFATENVPSFHGRQIERSTPKKLKYLEITSNSDFKNLEIDDNFGEVKFWDMIEKTLSKSSRHEDEL
jgi:hypothetical protein